MREAWRLLGLTLGSGPWNMAVDEAVLASVAAGRSPVTFRLYGWSRPCVSVGCVQPVADLNLAACAREDLPLVRRASGGTAVLHESAIAYSVALPSGHALAVPDVVESYRRFGPPVLGALRRLGIEGEVIPPERAHRSGRREGLGSTACFAALVPYEVVQRGRKLVGNSQLRRRGAVLHHAMLPLEFDAGRFAGLLRVESPEERDRLADLLESLIGSLSRARGEPVGLAAAADALAAGFAESLGVDFVAGDLSEEEQAEVRRLLDTKYAHPEWTHRR